MVRLHGHILYILIYKQGWPNRGGTPCILNGDLYAFQFLVFYGPQRKRVGRATILGHFEHGPLLKSVSRGRLKYILRRSVCSI